MSRTRWTYLLAALALPLMLHADEGMWTFDNIPAKKMQAKYAFTPDQAWLEHVRLASVRFPGGSGSFVSADGLVLTNHHVGHDWIQSVGDKDHDYVKNGFVAENREKEIKVPGLTLDTLMQMENITQKVEAAVKQGMSEKDATKARKEAIDALVKEMGQKTGLKCEAVVLYQGGETWIYGYKKHTDVRLVMAPEYQVAAFGKEDDNFTYPRHDLDFSLFRVYENGQPIKPAHHLTWAAEGVKAGDMTFTTGHPGRTSRLHTLARMEYERDLFYPMTLRSLDRMRKALYARAAEGPEQARQVSAQIMGVENSFKALSGQFDGLKNKEAMEQVKQAEKALRAAVAKDPKLNASTGQSWTKIEQALTQQRAIAKEARFLTASRQSLLLQGAMTLVRLTEEADKPADKRLPEFAKDEQVAMMKKRLEMDRPLQKEQEVRALTLHFTELQEELGAQHPYVKAALAGRKPAEAAQALVEGSKIADLATRKALLEGGKKAVAASQDPAIKLMRMLDPLNRKVRKQTEDLDAIIAEHSTRIAKARFAVYGKDTYPDATFTLRLSYGSVESYPANGTMMQPFTTFAGLFDRADGWGPTARQGYWDLPKRWRDKRTALNLSTPYNFITTNDIIGGNSGSPVVNRKGEFVGVAFDGNIESLPGNYYYDGKVNRCLVVDGRAIAEALKTVYDAPHLVKELTGK